MSSSLDKWVLYFLFSWQKCMNPTHSSYCWYLTLTFALSPHYPKCTPRPPVSWFGLNIFAAEQTVLGSAAATMSWMMTSISSLAKSSEQVLLWFYFPLGPSNLDEDHSITWSNKTSPIYTHVVIVVWVWSVIWDLTKWEIFCYRAENLLAYFV